jgi:hypothetical protein
VHTFSNAVTLVSAGPATTLTATDTSNGAIMGSVTVTVIPAATTHLLVNGIPDPSQAGVAHSVTVAAEDQFGNVTSGYRGTVTFSSSDTGAGVILPASYTFVAGDAGVHVFTLGVTLVTAGSQRVTAIDLFTPTINGSEILTVNPGSTTSLVVSGLPDPTPAGTPEPLTVTAEDQFGNVTPAYTGTVHFSSTDFAAILPADFAFVDADAGVVQFSGVTLFTTGPQTVRAIDTVNTTIRGSETVTVNP